MAEPEPAQALSARKLVLETAKFNVITAHSADEALELCKRFPGTDALIAHGNLPDHARVIEQYKHNHPERAAILLAPSHSSSVEAADHRVSSHNPEELLGLLRHLFGDPRNIDGR
jgi:DNA-binding response OmpR family regulator